MVEVANYQTALIGLLRKQLVKLTARVEQLERAANVESRDNDQS